VNYGKAILNFLGIQDVTITDIKIWQKRGEVEIKITQNFEKSHCCTCGLLHSKVHEWEIKVLKAPPLGIFKTVTLKYKRLRGYCESCKKNTLCVADFIHPEFKQYTCAFAETAGRLMEETTCEAASRLLDANSKSLWSLDQWRMKYLFQFMKLPENMDVTRLSADEVHFKSVKLERINLFSKFYDIKFITNLVCTSNSKVLFNAPGRDSEALEDTLSVLSKGQKLAVEYFAVDMHDPFISVIKTECPNAKICVDRFHVAQALNNGVEQVRESKLKSFLKFAKTIRKYRINIEAYIKSRLTTAVSEGLNNKIKVLKRMGYGYSNETSFRMKILQRCGFLNSAYIDTQHLFYSVPKP